MYIQTAFPLGEIAALCSKKEKKRDLNHKSNASILSFHPYNEKHAICAWFSHKGGGGPFAMDSFESSCIIVIKKTAAHGIFSCKGKEGKSICTSSNSLSRFMWPFSNANAGRNDYRYPKKRLWCRNRRPSVYLDRWNRWSDARSHLPMASRSRTDRSNCPCRPGVRTYYQHRHHWSRPRLYLGQANGLRDRIFRGCAGSTSRIGLCSHRCRPRGVCTGQCHRWSRRALGAGRCNRSTVGNRLKDQEQAEEL